MKITLYNIQANFYEDASKMGEMSPFLLFDGDDDAKMDKRGPHSGKTDVAKKAGAGPVNWDDRVELHLKGSMIKVQGKASKPLLPDKVLGEGQVQVGSGGRQQCQLTDPKTGTVVGEVSFEVSQGGGITGGTGAGTGGGMMSGTGGNQQQCYNTTGNQGYNTTGNQGYNTTGGQGFNTTGNQGVGQGYEQGRGQDFNTGSGVGNQGTTGQGGQGYNTTGGQVGGGQMTSGNQGYGNQQQGTGISGVGGGVGNTPQEQYEKTTHNKHDHDESESHEQRSVR